MSRPTETIIGAIAVLGAAVITAFSPLLMNMVRNPASVRETNQIVETVGAPEPAPIKFILHELDLGLRGTKIISTERVSGSKTPPPQPKPPEHQVFVLPNPPSRRRNRHEVPDTSLPVNPRTGEPLDMFRKRIAPQPVVNVPLSDLRPMRSFTNGIMITMPSALRPPTSGLRNLRRLGVS